MQNYKQALAERVSSAVNQLFPQSLRVNYGETNEGFFCDFDIAPITPAVFGQIAATINADGIDAIFELDRFSGVYEDGDAKNRSLQRIYVIAFAKRADFDGYKAFVAEAFTRDHKTLGNELKLFSSSPDIGQGLILWHPKGAMLRYLVERFGHEAHLLNGYDMVCTPHIGRGELWQKSGHLDFYRDSMYSPMDIDGEPYYLKPMNCPFHIHIYNSETRSYRDLPIKYAEYGTVYRYELSGALNGLTRVRGYTQDDAHIICTPEQVEREVTEALQFSLYILRSFGLTNFEPYISTKPAHKSIGCDSDWEMATGILKKAVAACGLAYKIDEGGGAFYGPKIDLKLRDALDREWQCSTIQFDFNLPSRFNMAYVGADGKRHTPYMIHRALFGSMERFIALLIEHHKGAFPLWYAPAQIGIVPIKEGHIDYAQLLAKELRRNGLRVKVEADNENMRNKIKRLELEKVPYVLVVGDKEIADKTFSVRSRKEGNLGTMDMEAFCEYLDPQISQGVPISLFEK